MTSCIQLRDAPVTRRLHIRNEYFRFLQIPVSTWKWMLAWVFRKTTVAVPDLMVERGQYSELRRRITRWATRPLFRGSDTRLAQTHGLSEKNIHRILICRPNHRLGNLLLLTPLVIEIQRLFPAADVDIVLAGEHVAELFQAFPNVKHIYNLSRRMVRHPVALVRVAVRIRRAHYDLAIDPCDASQSSRLMVAAAKPRYVSGVPRHQLARQAPAWMEGAPPHMAQRPVYMLRETVEYRLHGAGHGYPTMDIQLSAGERQRAGKVLRQLINTEGTRVVIGVFVEATGAKNYGGDWWRRFIGALGARHPDFAIVEIAPPDGRPRLASGFPFFSSPSPREVAAVIANMTCFVSADCGVMHLANAAGVPTLGLFSVTDPLKYAPYGHGSRALVTNGKSPEDVARAANALIETFLANGRPGAGSNDDGKNS